MLHELGYHVVRFKESEVRHRLDDVVWKLEKYLENIEKESIPPAPFAKGEKHNTSPFFKGG